MTCPKCQFQNPESEAVCQKCQAVLAVPKPPVAPIPPTVPPATAEIEQAVNTKNQEFSLFKSGRLWDILMLVPIAYIGVFALVFSLFIRPILTNPISFSPGVSTSFAPLMYLFPLHILVMILIVANFIYVLVNRHRFITSQANLFLWIIGLLTFPLILVPYIHFRYLRGFSLKKSVFIVAVPLVLSTAVLIFTFVGFFMKIMEFQRSVENITGSPSVIKNIPPDVLATPTSLIVPKTKYDIDSDGDAIPDFVETAIGFDPNFNNALICVKKSCEAPGQQTAQSVQTNILFILDASGSMAESISGGIKMDLAKQSLKKYAESLPTETNVGLMVYGHKGSNNTKDKAASCAGIETVYPMGEMNKSAFEAAFSKFSPTGWTVIGGALRKSANEFTGKDGQNNHVIVISDGIETCGSDPAGAAEELKNLSINPQIDVIGLAVDAAARTQLEEVAKIGGGTYKPANSALELEDALKKTIEAARESLVCSFKSSTAYQNCLILDQYRPASQYLQNLQLQALKDKDMEEEAAIRRAKSKLLDYWDKLYSQDVTISTKANQELYQQYEELRRQKN